MIVTIYKNILDTQTFFHRDIEEVLERIRTGKSKELIEKIRLEPDKQKRNILKKNLPSICFSGKFETRSAKSLIEHSGLICLDFDQFPTEKEMKENRQKLESDKYTFALFTSPSGDGLKVLVKIPAEKEKHKEYFLGLMEYYNSPNFDKNTSDVSRVCYESFDTKIFINRNSELFNIKVVEEEKELKIYESHATIPITSQNEIITRLLKWWEKKFQMVEGKRNTNLFVLVNAFNEYGISKQDAENICYKYETKDFTEREIDGIIESAYKKTELHGTKFFEDKKIYKKIETQIKSGASLKQLKREFPNLVEDQIEEITTKIKTKISDVEFWNYDKEGNITVTPHKYKEFLEENGFFKFYPTNSNTYVFVKLKENIIENISSEQIKDFVLSYLYNHEEFGNAPYDAIADNTKYFQTKYLDLIKSVDVNFKKDTKSSCFLYYKNSVLEIDENKINQIKYIDLGGFVWKNQIINRDFENVNFENCYFHKFISLLAGGDSEKFLAICSAIGFLLHSYKTSATNRAIILNDETISENPNGRSGKGLIGNAISKIKNVAVIDGKKFDNDKSFAYQTVQQDSQIIFFDDVKKNFSFENLFSLITEGITIEKKNKDAFKLPLEESPKVLISTNYTLGGMGGSHEGRKYEIELSSYFSSKHTPLDEFGHMFFDDWDRNEWLRFDNFMIYCLQVFLVSGLRKSDFVNLELRKFIKDTSFEFTEWAIENLPIGERIYQSTKYDEFVDEYSDFKKWLTKKKFKQWIESYAKYLKKEVQNGKEVSQRFIIIL
jgi:hypothetical protein